MSTIVPNLDIYRSKNRQLFCILRYTIQEGTGFRVSTGNLLKLEIDDMRRKGLDLVLEGFKIFGCSKGRELSEYDRMPPSARRRFISGHAYVCVFLDESGTKINICPMQYVPGNGAIGVHGAAQSVRLPISPEGFYQILNKAFDKC